MKTEQDLKDSLRACIHGVMMIHPNTPQMNSGTGEQLARDLADHAWEWIKQNSTECEAACKGGNGT